jgi:pimeloyl-ACP methyl ester carboxylesterase
MKLTALLIGLFTAGLPAAVGLPAAAEALVPSIKTVDVGDGIALHYVEQGHGTPLIFVHGSLSDGAYWNEQRPEFAKHYRVIAYSRRYNYPNLNPSRPGYSAITDAEDLSTLIKRLRLGKVYVVGHSYGALSALFLTVNDPEQVRRVVLAEPPAVPLLKYLRQPDASTGMAMYEDIQHRTVWPMQTAFRGGQREAGVAAFIDYVFDDPQAWQKFSAASKQAALRDAHEWDVIMTSGTLFPDIDPAAVAHIDLPVMIISRGKSYPFIRLIDRALTALIPGSEHFVLPRDGHQMWYQDPVACRQAVEAFFERDDRRAHNATLLQHRGG